MPGNLKRPACSVRERHRHETKRMLFAAKRWRGTCRERDKESGTYGEKTKERIFVLGRKYEENGVLGDPEKVTRKRITKRENGSKERRMRTTSGNVKGRKLQKNGRELVMRSHTNLTDR